MPVSRVSFQFTEEQWEAIRSLRNDWPPEARDEIEGFGRVFWLMRRQREQLGAPAKVRKAVQSLLRQTRSLQKAQQKAFPDSLRALAHDPNLKRQEQWLETLLIVYERLTGPEFSRRRDYYRDCLYEDLLEYWAAQFGQLSFSTKQPENKPYGPLIDFLTLAVKAILGKAPGPSRMAKIIDQYRAPPTSPFER